MRKLLTALFFAALCGTASAAEITLTEREGYKPVIEVTGRIVNGDSDKFLAVIGKHRRGIVIMEGPGGDVDDALRIGVTIAARGFATYVRPVKACHSGCALMWLVGKDRYIGKSGQVGFHTVYNVDTKERREPVNDWIRHTYLQYARLKPAVADYITKAGPDEIALLTPKDAKRVGIPVQFNAEPDWKAQ